MIQEMQFLWVCTLYFVFYFKTTTYLRLQMACQEGSVMTIFAVKMPIQPVQTMSVGVILGTQKAVEFALKVISLKINCAFNVFFCFSYQWCPVNDFVY